ncbi:carboxypeptidase-like regulatory domain-containing protein [Mucilaginibacter mali]|uniref:Carboxypeptidase-like regulatory domain-containing protein n=1 Tax=Mucilaginibacter mali TaxID=2740462 RepID=A0A7D4PU87_9SPHI|nr:DUF5686 and carboxypeptidase-like regulatory domain-containing protein [Mucilaginibacter mali]QKJ30508.1 carboxypeptidase-like regulatory domain-containing protein [Mucilaginibacter mali]
MGLLLWNLGAAGQQTLTVVSGQVVDASGGQPLNFVTVSFVGSNLGGRTDSLGRFKLSGAGSFTKVAFSCVGYLPVVKTILPGHLNKLQVLLVRNTTELASVTIASSKGQRYRNKGNPAVELIQQVIDHKEENRATAAAFLQYEQYERMGLSFFNLPPQVVESKFFSKYRFMLDTVQGQTFLPVLLEEKLSDIYYRRQPEKHTQTQKAYKGVNILQFIDTAGMKLYVNQLYGHQLDIYENNLFIMANQFLSPIADHAPNYYKFFITDTLNTPTGKQVELAFTPRTKGDLLFEGKLVVTLDGHYAVTACELRLNRHINVSFVRSFDVLLDFTAQTGGRYQLTKSQVKADFGLTKKGWGVFGERTVVYRNYLNDSVQVVSPKKTGFDTLSRGQAQVYEKLYKLEQMPSYKRTMWWLVTLTAGYADTGPVQIGPVAHFLSFNSQEGLRPELGLRTTPKLDSSFYFEGYGAYGIKDHLVKGNAIAYFSLNKTAPYRFPNNYFKASYLYDVDVPGHTFSITNRPTAFSSFQTGKTNYWLYSRIMELNYVRDFEDHFSYNLGFKNWQQSPAAALVYQRNDDGSLVSNLTTSELNLHLRYAPHEELIQGSRTRHSIHSPYPIYDLLINRSIGSTYSYTDFGLNIYKRVYLSQAGFTDVTLLGGYVQGKVPFPLLNISPANQSLTYRRDAYNAMNYLEFVSDHYAGMNVTHTFNGFLLNKVPLIKHLKLREFLSAKILYGGLRTENDPAQSKGLYRLPPNVYALGNTPYVEGGVGIGNIFRFFRVDLIRRFNYLDHPDAAAYRIKFSFQPEF